MLRTCSACGASNRIPAQRLTDTARCGSCKTDLPPIEKPIDADAALFREVVENARVPVLVDFWAEWCGPCKIVAPEVAAVAKEMAGKLIVLKLNTEQEPALAQQWRIQSIPNFIVFRNGKPVLERAGAMPRAELKRWLEGPLAN